MSESRSGTPWLLGEVLPVELMNTLWADRDGHHDQLATATSAAGWLAAHQDQLPLPVPATLRRQPLTDLRDLRDALRRLAALDLADDRPGTASPVPDQRTAVEIVNRCCAAAPTWSRLVWTPTAGPQREPQGAAGAAEVAVASIAEQAVALFTGDRRAQLRACPAPGCLLYFLRGHPRRGWCSDACGNRVRVARHYRSRHPAPQ